jgi:CheY-like chemotaxis protein
VRCQILLVDDHPFTPINFQKALKLHGYTCATARSVAEAWGILERDAPRALIVDFHMPGVNGLEFLRALRQQPEFKLLPVAIVSADWSITDATRAEILRLGASFPGAILSDQDLLDVARAIINEADLLDGQP